MMPAAIRNFLADARLEIDWQDGSSVNYSHEVLRVQCPCAACRGHGADQGRVISGKADVRLTHLELVGNYAIHMEFDDGHQTGIYTFDVLREIGS